MACLSSIFAGFLSGVALQGCGDAQPSPAPTPTPAPAPPGAIEMQYETDAHGAYVALLCSKAKSTYCQLNAHVVFMVAPTNLGNNLDVGAEYELDGSGKWMPLGTDYEYMMWNASTPFITTGRASRQYKGMLQANMARAQGLPKKFCTRVWAQDLSTGHSNHLERECFKITQSSIAVPQTQRLDGRVNHAPVAYYCDAAGDCLFNAHLIISTYATDPTNSLFGGGEMRLDSGDWSSKGVRVLLQAKPTMGAGGLYGPRVQLAYEARGLSLKNIPQQACFKSWVGDANTGETADVVANDEGEPLPEPVAPGVFCYNTTVVLREPTSLSSTLVI